MVRQGCVYEELEDTKVVIRTRKWKERQHNYQKKKNKGINNDLQNTTQKTKDREIQAPLKPDVNPGAPEE